MAVIQLKHGSKLTYLGAAYQVIGRPDERERLLLLNDETFDEVRLTQAEIAAKIAEAEIELVPDVSSSKNPESLRQNLQIDPISLSPKAYAEYERRRRYLSAILAEQPRFYSERYILPILNKIAAAAGESPPNISTVYRWRREYLDANRDIRGLIPNYRRRGNRRRRLEPTVIKMIEEAIAEYYLLPECPPATHVAAAVVAKINKVNRDLPLDLRLTIPSDNTIRRAIAAIQPDIRVRAREGKRAEFEKFKAAMSGPQPTRALERWEMDHCKLDIYIIDDDFKSPYGRPWLTTIVDVYSGMVVGFNISFDAPNRQAALAALKHAVLSKATSLKEHPNLKSSWDACGVPTTLVVDNGPEFHSPDFVHACQCLGINIQYTKAQSPWLKGTIERFFGSINRSLLAGLKGYTFPNITDRREYDPKKNAVLGLKDIHNLIIGWIVDFHNQRAKRKGWACPAALWRESTRRFPIPHVASVKDVAIALMCADERTLTRKGIEFHGLEYNSPELESITRTMGERVKVPLKYDPADVSSIFVITKTGHAIRVMPKDKRMHRPISIWKLQKIGQYKANLNAGGKRVDLYEAMHSLLNQARAAAAEAKKGEVSKLAMKFLRGFIESANSPDVEDQQQQKNTARPVKVVADPAVAARVKEREQKEISRRMGNEGDWGRIQR